MSSELIQTSDKKYCCEICKKPYTKKDSLEKHKLLCEYKSKSQQEKQIEFEELGDIPNHNQLVRIVQELAIKYAKIEERLAEMQKWVTKKKTKLNVVGWLNMHAIPDVGFQEWLTQYITVTPKHFELLFDINLTSVIQEIFEHNLVGHDSDESEQPFRYPIRCFSEKKSTIYICEFVQNTAEQQEQEQEQLKPSWTKMEQSELSKLMTKIHGKLLQNMILWKEQNQAKFDDDSKIAERFNKAVIKFMDMKYTLDSNLAPYKSALYNYLKTDLKGIMEYEFEF